MTLKYLDLTYRKGCIELSGHTFKEHTLDSEKDIFYYLYEKI